MLQNNVLMVVAFNIKGDSIGETDDTLHVVCFNRVILGNSYIIFCVFPVPRSIKYKYKYTL